MLSNIEDIINTYLVKLKDFEPLGDTPFRLNALNGVYAPAKAGKTYFTLDQLNSLDPDVYKVIWLDGDRNAELKDKFKNIKHFPVTTPSDALMAIIDSGNDLTDHVLVIDSFKDFTFGYDIDNNKGCQNILETYQKLLDLGATLIVILHATKLSHMSYGDDFKLKGNADTIESKMDFLYKTNII